MSGQAQNTAREALAAYAEGRADKDRVMRALVAHNGWFVPAPFANGVLGEAVFERTILLGAPADAPPTDLVIFTDPESVLTAYGQPLGPYVGGVRGLRVFAALDDFYESLRVNPASAEQERWIVDREGFAIAKLWVDAVALERNLVGAAERGFPHARIKGYRGFTILIATADRTPVLSKLSDGESTCALAFTAPDRAAAFVARLPAETQPSVTTATLDGASLFSFLSQMNVVGLLVNNDEPAGAVFVPRAEFEKVVNAS